MTIQFDPINKYILITSGTSISALEIYNAAMDWCDAQENMGYPVPMKAVGKFPMGGGINSDSIFILINGWKIKLYDGNYQFIFTGTIITDDESARTVPPEHGNVEMVFQVSSQGTVVGDIKEMQTQIEDVDTKIGDVDIKVEGVDTKIDKIGPKISDIVSTTSDIKTVQIGRAEVTDDDYLIIYDEVDGDKVQRKFKLIRDAQGRIIERIPEQ